MTGRVLRKREQAGEQERRRLDPAQPPCRPGIAPPGKDREPALAEQQIAERPFGEPDQPVERVDEGQHARQQPDRADHRDQAPAPLQRFPSEEEQRDRDHGATCFRFTGASCQDPGAPDKKERLRCRRRPCLADVGSARLRRRAEARRGRRRRAGRPAVGTEARRFSGAGSSTTLRITGSPRSTVRISSPDSVSYSSRPRASRCSSSMFSVRMLLGLGIGAVDDRP